MSSNMSATRQRKRDTAKKDQTEQSISNGGDSKRVNGYLEHTKMADSTVSQSSQSTRDEGKRLLMLIMCFFGIFISYFIYGLLQEKM